MMTIHRSSTFDKWLLKLKDRTAKAKVTLAIERLEMGLYGDVKPVGQGISEIRIHYAGGYRIYFMQQGSELIVLLAGGDKSSQKQDIIKAKSIAEQWRDTV